ncbi:MAG: site-2 protease family protein [Candidatus Binatia bacterium]
MESSFTLFRVRGIPIGANWSWLIVFALIVYSLAGQLFPRTYPGLDDPTYLVMAIVAGVLFVTSLVLHELGHAFRAQREGMEIDGITLWLFGGVARFKGMFPSAGAEFRIAIAGPVVSAALAAGFFALRWVFAQADGAVTAVGVTDYLWRINALLLLFNMVPALPLDGGRVLRAYLWQRKGNFAAATLSAARTARALAGGLIGIGVLLFITGAGLGGLWIAFIGWFLLQAAQSEASFALFRQAMRGVRVRDLMSPDPQATDPRRTIASFIDDVAHVRGHSTYPVLDDGRLAGLVSLRMAARVPSGERQLQTVRDVMLPADSTPVVAPDTEIVDVMAALQQEPGRAVVVSDGRVVGIISGSDVARAIELEQIRGTQEPVAERRRPFGWIALAVAGLAALGLLYRPPLVVLNPGESFDVVGDIRIEGVPAGRVEGRYLLTSVAISQPNGFGLVLAVVQSKEMLPLRTLIPPGREPDEFFDEQRQLFTQTQMVAAGAAARAAGMDVRLSGRGAVVADVVRGSPADGVLEDGDVIESIDGDGVELASDVGRVIRSRPAGTAFSLGVERDGGRHTFEIASRAGVVRGAPGIGVELQTRDLDVDLPFDVSFRQREIGGPSAGLTYALAIYDLIDPADTARGRSVASTGEIDLEGRVGPVGGLPEKAVAARRAGAELFLVPSDEVRDASGVTIDVVGVASLEEALDALRSAS